MSNIPTQHIQAFCDYFRNGAHDYRCIGVSVEHIIVYSDTKEAVPYNGDFGVSFILSELSSFYPEVRISRDGPLLGFRTDRFKITLQPGSQLEISIMPFEDLQSVRKIYETFRTYLDEVIAPYEYECITEGYQPASPASDIHLIPMRRYDFMDRYFKHSGTHGTQLMRGTAFSQISIDYSSEEDFLKKIKVLYFLSPYIKLISDNSPNYEGSPNSKILTRSFLWDNVDDKRCGFIPGVMQPDFSFEKYAEYLLSLPPIFIPKSITGGDDIYTGDALAYELIGDAPLTDAWINHLVTMAFPEVRLKNYLEFRVADSIPKDRLFGILALVKGIIYQDSLVDYIIRFIDKHNIDETTIRKVTQDVSVNGWDATFYNMSLRDAHVNLMNSAKAVLSDEELEYLFVLPMP